MIGLSARTNPADLIRLKLELDARLRKVALTTTARAAEQAKAKLRSDMSAAGLGRLGFAIGDGSDLRKNRTVKEQGGGRWSASGWLFIRGKSPRTIGAVISYTEGATIAPRKGRWLWIATDDVKRLVGVPLPKGGEGKGKSRANVRLEPYLWDRTYGQKFGQLQVIKSINGYPLLILKNPASVSASGKRGSLKPLGKRGQALKGQVKKDFIVAFIGIPNTSRAARVRPLAIAQKIAMSLPSQIRAEFQLTVK